MHIVLTFIKRLLLLGIILILIAAVVFSLAVVRVFQFYDGTAVLPADCAVVFGAAVHRGDTAGPGIQRRVQTAVELQKAGDVQHLFLTGGRGEDGQASEAEVMKEVALEAGVPSSLIHIEESSSSTWENLVHTRPLTVDCDSVVGISDRYHLARIHLLAHRQDWDDLMVYPAHWVATPRFEAWSVVREALGLLYYKFTPNGRRGVSPSAFGVFGM